MPYNRQRRFHSARMTMGKGPNEMPPLDGADGFELRSKTNTLVINHAATPANNYVGPPGGKLAVTRVSTALNYDSNNLVVVTPINTLRLDYDARLGDNLKPGYLMEDARANAVKWSNDLTNIVWTPTNITAALDQTGPDGVVNSASSITATAANGTISQALTGGVNAMRVWSAFVKRLAGTGVIEMTYDGITWTPVTVTGSWNPVELPSLLIINPTPGFRIATSGDSIAVWCAQCEHGTINVTTACWSRGSPIPTGAASVSRGTDGVKLAGTLFPLNLAEGTLYVKFMSQGAVGIGTQTVIALDDNTAVAERVYVERTADNNTKKVSAGINDTGGQGAAWNSINICAHLTPWKSVVGYKFNDSAVCHNGEPMPAPSTTNTLPTTTQCCIGTRSPIASNTSVQGWILEVLYKTTRMSNTELLMLAAP